MSSSRPFSILGLQQIAVGGADKHSLRRFWVDLLGLTYRDSFVSEAENVDEDICQLGVGATAVESGSNAAAGSTEATEGR